MTTGLHKPYVDQTPKATEPTDFPIMPPGRGGDFSLRPMLIGQNSFKDCYFRVIWIVQQLLKLPRNKALWYLCGNA